MAVETYARAKVSHHCCVLPKEVYVAVFHNSPLINQLDTRAVTVSFQFEKTFNRENVLIYGKPAEFECFHKKPEQNAGCGNT
jgi:hypothetical protein